MHNLIFKSNNEFKDAVNLLNENMHKNSKYLVELIEKKHDKLADLIENKDKEQRRFTLKMFTLAITLTFSGVIGFWLKVLR